MRTQTDNPAYREFQHLVLPSGRYPAKFVDIFWNHDNDSFRGIRDVEVVFIPRGEVKKLLGDQRAEEFWGEYASYNKRWKSDLGNSTSDWLTEVGFTPETIFGNFLGNGFASPKELERALEELGHIEECEWARLMLQGFRDE